MHFSHTIAGALLFALAISVNACGPQGPHGGHGGHFFGMGHGVGLAMRAARFGGREMRQRGGFRRACADDVARLCPAAKSRREERECLEGKESTLSSDCKTALEHRRDTAR